MAQKQSTAPHKEQYNSNPLISCSFFKEGATHCMTTHLLSLGVLAAIVALEDLVPL
jgi:hypothetical protein